MLHLAFILSVTLCISSSLRAEEWMGLEDNAQTIIGIQTSTDKNNNQSQSVSFFTTLGESFSVDVNQTKYQLSNDTNTLNSVNQFTQISWLSSETTAFRIAQQFDGKERELETNQTQIQFDYTPYPWTLSLLYIEGDVDIYTQQRSIILRSFPLRLNSAFSASGITFNWWFDTFALSFSQTNYQYNKKISNLSTRPVFQLIIKPQALIHSALLLSKEQQFSVQIPFETRSFTFQYFNLISAVDSSSNHIISADWTESITPAISLLSRISQTLTDDGPWSLSLGLEWDF